MKVITLKSKLFSQQIHYGVAVWAVDYSPCAPGSMSPPPPPLPLLNFEECDEIRNR